MTKDDVLFGYRQQLFCGGSEDECFSRVPYVGGAPLDLLPMQAPGRPARP